jgi:poly(ribitol-phosphate) beta-N-acetylglucosaminyltransferase
MPTDPHVRVSVVVPVYNPGEHIESLITSLARQTMPQEQFEVIFSDDGSTDDTPARLDRLAAERSNVMVIHEPNSGWPGRPRNLGMDLSRGEYVFFVDQDDWLGTEALDRMWKLGNTNRSDIVIGRYAGHHRGVAKAPFHRTRPDATLQNTPLMDSLTPHKMFRANFLAEHDLRFPEGRRRLEDHVFVVRAYFLAERIAVLADYHCYFHVGRADAGNAGYRTIDPAGYYGNVREVVDIVLTHTQPGSLRDRCLRRTLRTEVLSRLDGNGFLGRPPAYRRALFDEARRLVEETMPLTVDAGLSPPQRVRASLLRTGRLDDFVTCTNRFLEVRPSVRLIDMRWNRDGELAVEAEGFLLDPVTGLPWKYAADGERTFISPPSGLLGPYPRQAAECTVPLQSADLRIFVRRREDSEEWTVPTHSTAEMHRQNGYAWVSLRATARIDPQAAGGGTSLSHGVWDVYARIIQTGWSKDVRLGQARTPAATAGLRPALIAGSLVVPYWTRPHGNLSLEIGATGAQVASRIRDGSWDARIVRARDATSVLITVPIFALGGNVPPAQMRLVSSDESASAVELVGLVRRQDRYDVTLSAPLPRLRPGEWQLQLNLGISGWDTPRGIGVALAVPPKGISGVTVVSGAAPKAERHAPRRLTLQRLRCNARSWLSRIGLVVRFVRWLRSRAGSGRRT